MKNRLIYNTITILFVFTIISIPTSEAWTWETHSDVIETVYNGLPADVQQKLNLSTMKDGSNDPDEKFKDFTYHSYPKSYEKAKTWLNKGKNAYNGGDYTEASYDYGVASHYISDSFSAPHCTSGESSADHTKYEDQAKKLNPTATYTTGDLNTMMQEGYNQGKSSWNNWLQNKNSAIVEKDLNRGASATLSAIKDNNTKSGENIFDSLINYIFSFFKLK